jgi:hypothetical protein
MYQIGSGLVEVKLEDLRPTQMTVGYKEVEEKRKSWLKLKPAKRRQAMRQELFPAVIGPNKTYYILDHHHAAVALVREKSDRVAVGVAKDLSHLKPESFWIYLDHFSWVHPYDNEGMRRPFADIPDNFEDLKDDPFRSLSSDLLNAGGFAKPGEPFLEFLWANYFRDRLSAKLVARNPKKALSEALALAKSKDASHLPGWPGKA